MNRKIPFLIATLVVFVSHLYSDDAREQFSNFYADAPQGEALSFSMVRVVLLTDEMSIVYHLKGRISGSNFELFSHCTDYSNQSVDVEFERSRDIDFGDFPDFVKNSHYEFEFSVGNLTDGQLPSVERLSIYSDNGQRSPMPEIFGCIGDVQLGRTLKDLVDDKRVTFVSFGQAQWYEENELCLEVEIKDRTLISSELTPWRIQYFFDAQTKYCVGQRHWTNRTKDFGSVVLKYEKNPSRSGLIPLKSTETFALDKEAGTHSKLCTYAEVLAIEVIDPVGEPEFRLSRFGLPDPYIGATTRRSSYIWVILICCVLVGLGIYWRKAL